MVALVVVGLLCPLWEYGPLVGAGVLAVVTGWTRSWRLGAATAAFLVAGLVGHQPFPAAVALSAALLIAAHDLHARRPGEWFPLLATGLGVLVAFLGEEYQGLPPMVWNETTDSTVVVEYTAIAVAPGGMSTSDWALTVLVAVVVALGLAWWAWRARSLVVIATAAAYLAVAWYQEPEVSLRPEVVLFVGAALAYGVEHGWRDWLPPVFVVLGLLLTTGTTYYPPTEDFGWFAYEPLNARAPFEVYDPAAENLLVFAPVLGLAGAAVALVLRDRRTRVL
ncbi:MAG: hypothetical protein HOY78_01250 [Saccharothrix sp.]|nr:hypothetical protein [Saccharothrix sp.]